MKTQPKSRISKNRLNETSLKSSANRFQQRRKYDDGYGTVAFDHWSAAFTVEQLDTSTREILAAYDLDPTNPYHWRALVDALIEQLPRVRGRPSVTSSESFISLALDIIETVEADLSIDRTSQSAIAAALQKSELHAYRDINERTLRGNVKEVIERLGPIDESAFERLAQEDRQLFAEVYCRRPSGRPD